jgi:hypothetical protein
LGSAFFKPYKSPANVFFRTTSIFTDRVLFAVGSAFFVISAAVELIKAFASLIVLNFADAKENFKEAGGSVLVAALLFVVGVASPLVNLVDLIGGGVASLIPNSPEGEEVQQQSIAQYN